jgi:hypothetical protein
VLAVADSAPATREKNRGVGVEAAIDQKASHIVAGTINELCPVSATQGVDRIIE